MASAKKLRLSSWYNLYDSVSTISKRMHITVLWTSGSGKCRRVMSQPRAIRISTPNVAALFAQSTKTPALLIQSGRYPILLTVSHLTMATVHASILNRGTKSMILCSVVMVAECSHPNQNIWTKHRTVHTRRNDRYNCGSCSCPKSRCSPPGFISV